MKSPRLRSLALLVTGVAAAGCARHVGGIGGFVPSTSPQFETRTEISTGTGTHTDYCVADFDNDTFLDMAVLSLSGEMKVLHGNGTTFVAGQELNVGGGPLWIAGGDLDGDGDLDLAVVRATANNTQVFWNDGSGTFTAGPTMPVGADALAVLIGDVDGDGHRDIIVSRQVAPEVYVFAGDGAGNFGTGTPLSLPGGGAAMNIALGDATHDGLGDLVVTDPVHARVAVYPGSSAGITPVPYELSVPGGPRAVSIGDLTSDGLADLAVSAFDAGKLVIVTSINTSTGPGPVSFTADEVQLESAPAITTIADVTGDGRLDLVSCQLGAASILVIPQLPGGVLGEVMSLDATGLPLRPFVGDFDHDGHNDLCALSGLGDRINLWLAKTDGTLAGARNYAAGVRPAAFLAGGDFNHDGKKEIAVGGPGSSHVCILESNATGGLDIAYNLDVGADVLQVTTADLDLDGYPDLLATVSGGVKVLRNNASGNYDFTVLPGLAATVATAAGPFGVAAADIDRDGHFDLAVCDYTGSALHIVFGTGTPFQFANETVIPLQGNPADVVAADFTGDGLLDLAVSRVSMSDIVILQNNGNGQFSLFLSVPVGQTPTYLITGDFNRDLRADLVVSNSGSGTITILFGGQNGFTDISFPAGQAPTALLAGDLTGDGIDDVLVTSLQSGDFRVLVGDGFGSFPEIARFPGTLGASDAVLQDMSGDGKADLVVSSLVTNRVSLVRNAGARTALGQ